VLFLDSRYAKTKLPGPARNRIVEGTLRGDEAVGSELDSRSYTETKLLARNRIVEGTLRGDEVVGSELDSRGDEAAGSESDC